MSEAFPPLVASQAVPLETLWSVIVVFQSESELSVGVRIEDCIAEALFALSTLLDVEMYVCQSCNVMNSCPGLRKPHNTG